MAQNPQENPIRSPRRQAVLDAAREYFQAEHAPKAFVPGQSYIPASGKVIEADDLEALLESSLDLWFTSGRFHCEFEKTLPRKFGRQVGALLVNSGSSANLLALSSLGSPMMKKAGLKPLERGDEVITVACGFPTTVNPIIQNGWVPVFVDVDTKTLNALPEKVMEAWTPKTRAVILAHTLGNPYRSDILEKWCTEKGLFFIEDCCDALGASIQHGDTAADTKPVGAFADYATVSFYPAHHITTGEGGAVMSRNIRFRRVAESMRDWGRDCWCDTGKDNTCGKRYDWQLGGLPPGYDHKYIYSSVGYNLKVTDMQAALGVSQLKKAERFVEVRRANWNTLYQGIKSSPKLAEHLVPTEPTERTNPSWFGFPMLCREVDRAMLTRKLEEAKVGTRLVFAGNLTKQPAYEGTDFRVVGSLDGADRVMRDGFWIGVHPGLTKAHLDTVLQKLEDLVPQCLKSGS